MIELIKHTEYINLISIGRPDIFLKLECNQFGNSFKSRGIVSMLEKANNIKGLVTYTTGNHGIALAAIAKELGIDTVVVSSVELNTFKRKIIESYGASVQIIESNNIDYTTDYVKQIANEKEYHFIPLFGDEDLLEGYSGITKEIYTDFEDEFQLYFPVGSGTLLLANAKLSKSQNSLIKVIGVEPKIYQRLNGLMLQDDVSESIAESLSINKIPDINKEVLSYIDEVALINEEEIVQAMRLLHEHYNLITEPGGAIAFAAALKTEPNDIKKIAVITGKNISELKFKEIISI